MAAPPSTYAVHGEGAGGSATVLDGTETIAFDASWGGEPSGLPGPAELLARAFTACMVKNLERAVVAVAPQ